MTCNANDMTLGDGSGPPSPDYDSATQHRKTLLGAVDLTVWGERLQQFMAQQPGIIGDVQISDLSIPSAGGSSGTILFAVTHDGPRRTRIARRCVLRHATEGGLFHSYDLPGQYSILSTLQDSEVVVPGIMGIDPKGDVLGVPGYVMERIEGEAPAPSYHQSGVLKDASPERRRFMVRDALGNLARLHMLDITAPGFAFLRARGAGATAAERDINWYWAALQWGSPDTADEVAPARQWLLDNQPPETRLSVCHGDAMLANYMFRDGKVVAVLDWEMAFFGYPAHDVAYQFLAHKLLGIGSEPLEGMPTEEEWKADYEQISGMALRHWEYCAAETAYKLHVALLLVYRETTPGMEAARDTVLKHTSQTLADRLAAAKRHAA